VKKQKMVSSIADAIEDAGIKALVANMKREELKKILGPSENEEGSEEKEVTQNKIVLSKRLREKISAVGIHDFLQDHADEDLLKDLCLNLDVEADSEKKEELVSQVSATVQELGMESYFGSFNVEYLQDVCEDLKLKTGRTSNKRKLVECILRQENAVHSPRKKKKVQYSKKKQAISKNSTYEDIFQHYYVDEVRDWCRENGLKTSGKKGVLIKRILAYLDGDETTKATATTGRKAKSNGASKAKEAKEAKEAEAEEEEEKKEEGDEEEAKEEKKGTKNGPKKNK